MAILTCLILAVAFTGWSEAAEILPDGPLNAAVGGSVMINTTLTEADGPFNTVIWNFNFSNYIISYNPSFTDINPVYQDRITFFPSTASLELRDLTLNDRGVYTVSVIPNGGGQINLDIFVPVSSVTVTPKSADLVEFSSFSLTCSSSGSSLSFIWMNSSSEVTSSDRVQITDGGSTLTVVDVTRYDEQSYRCRVFNPVSEGISDPVNILVSYGPENTKMSASPPQEFYEEGSDISLSCSADSRPSAQFTWFVNGTKLPDSGPELTLRNIQFSQRGDYSCQAFNSKTLTNETSPSVSISILQKISGVSIKASTEQIIEGSSVTLTCEASGSSPSRTWKKDGSDLNLSENVTLSEDNTVLTFKAVKKENSGEYVCLVSNPVSSSEAKFTIVVNYGPENVQIEGKDLINENDQIKLICSAESTPSATFTWRLNGSEIIGSSAEFLKEKAQSSDSGTYTCEAKNTVTEKQSTAEHELHVQIGAEGSSGCSAGCIAGIVIAVIVVVAAGIGGGFYIYKSKSSKRSSSRDNRRGRDGQDNTSYASEDVNYADIKFSKNKNKNNTTLQMDTENVASNYAQIRVNNQPAGTHPPNYDAHMQRVNRQVS
ncbi:Carcinoembryonic antigen-related cell adhesion molecule 5 [Oryzias melastigma]|uniref:Carcinoembryonic antigen-related cell adhesion molecule 5 n=1 Tax=Oryzias melastigma TaxID=30732 RepID=A0A834EWT5_ORYME|nr:Carcinoembryonic antigen-related cell adhesion molecule 5 [Oryzias melastigma]